MQALPRESGFLLAAGGVAGDGGVHNVLGWLISIAGSLGADSEAVVLSGVDSESLDEAAVR